MRNNGETLKYIAYALGKDLTTIARHVKPKFVHNKWTENDKLKAHILRNQNYSYSKIGKELGRTMDAVKQFFMNERKRTSGGG